MIHVVVYLLAAFGAGVILMLIVLAIAYVTVQRRVSQRLQQAMEEINLLLQAQAESSPSDGQDTEGQFVPPMRIHFEAATSNLAPFQPHGLKVHQQLIEWGFELMGQYVVEELQDECIRIYLDDSQHYIALLRRPQSEQEPYIEFCFVSTDGELGGVANPPRSTVQLPADVLGRYYNVSFSEEPGLAARMWSEVQELAEGLECIAIENSPESIARIFEDAHAEEMDYRLVSGGLSEAEILQSLSSQGTPVSADDVEMVQASWQAAIEQHLLDFSPRGLNHHILGREILVVYDGSVNSYLINRIGRMLEQWEIVDERSRDEIVAILEELQELLNRFTPREAIARFRPLLPQKLRYDLVDQLSMPVEADFYVLSEI